MKKITYLLILFTITIGFSQTTPQSLPFGFDESADPVDYFTCFDCTFSLTTDPDDAGNAVGQLTGNPNQFYDTAQTLNLPENIDLSDDSNNTISFRIRPVNGTGSGSHLLKFEGGAPIVQLPFTTTGTGWQTITLDFGPGLGNYSNMIIFPDFESNSADSYLIDDISGGTNVAPPPPPSAEFPIDFSTSDDTFDCFDCAFIITQDAGNDVGSITGGGLAFDTAQLKLGTKLDLSDDGNNTIAFRIKPVNGTGSGSHLLKFEGGSGPIVELPFTTTGTNWQNISLDFGAGLGNYDLVVIFTDFNNTSTDTYLIDDIAGGANVVPLSPPSTTAPNPTTPDAEVFSLYSDTGGYTNNMVYDYSFGTLAGEIDLDDTAGVNNALQFDFSVAGWGSGQNTPTNVSTSQFVHFQYWTSDATQFYLDIISQGTPNTEAFYTIGVDEPIVYNVWTSVTIPISHFTAQSFDVNNWFQYKFDVPSNLFPGTVYIDNVYFSNSTPTLSISNIEISGYKVFPNPATDRLTIMADDNIENIQVYNLLGQQLININSVNNRATLNISKLNQGIYVVRTTVDGAIGTKRFIKQ